MGNFYKQQTKWTWLPASIYAKTSGGLRHAVVSVAIRSGYSTDPEHPCESCRKPQFAEIDMTPNEAMALAAWLQTEAERIVRRQKKAESRRTERAARKRGAGNA